MAGEGDERAERAGLEGGREEREHTETAGEATLWGVQDGVPENDRGEKETEVLEGVGEFAVEGGLEERGDVPEPEREEVDGPRDEGTRELRPKPAGAESAVPEKEFADGAAGERPEEDEAGPAEYKERRGGDHEELVLRHVRGEKFGAPRVQRRHERDDEAEPAGEESEGGRAEFAGVAGGAAQTVKAAGIEEGGEREREDDAGFEGPGAEGNRDGGRGVGERGEREEKKEKRER